MSSKTTDEELNKNILESIANDKDNPTSLRESAQHLLDVYHKKDDDEV